MTRNTIDVLTTIERARIGDTVVATSRHDSSSTDQGRLVETRIDELVLEKANGHRIALAHEDWTFTAILPVETYAIQSIKVGCPVCASKPEGPTLRPRQNLHPNPAFREGVDGWATDAEPNRGEPTAFEEHAAGLAASRLERVQELEAEVERLTALVENKQTVINEDRADTKRNREIWAAKVADLEHAVALEVDRTNDANQRADELVARIQELEVEAARHEHALEKADGLIQALRRRYGTHVVLQRAQADDDRAARLIREADEQNSAARGLTKQKPRTGRDPRVWALAPDAAGLAFAGFGTAHDALHTFQMEPTPDKFAKFLHIADLGEYTKVLERAAREMAAAEQAGVQPVLNQILDELRRLGKRADTRARAARKASTR